MATLLLLETNPSTILSGVIIAAVSRALMGRP